MENLAAGFPTAKAGMFNIGLLHTSLDDVTYERLAEDLRRDDPEGRRLLDERKTIDVDLDALARLPRGTLGREFVRFLRDNGLEPFSYTHPVSTDGQFLYKRYRETHDLHHVVTGYGADPLGEIELQAFYCGNLGLRHAGLIGLLSLVTPPTRGDELGAKPSVLQRLRAAYHRGKASRPLLAVHFDELWDRSVAELAGQICAPSR